MKLHHKLLIGAFLIITGLLGLIVSGAFAQDNLVDQTGAGSFFERMVSVNNQLSGYNVISLGWTPTINVIGYPSVKICRIDLALSRETANAPAYLYVSSGSYPFSQVHIPAGAYGARFFTSSYATPPASTSFGFVNTTWTEFNFTPCFYAKAGYSYFFSLYQYGIGDFDLSLNVFGNNINSENGLGWYHSGSMSGINIFGDTPFNDTGFFNQFSLFTPSYRIYNDLTGGESPLPNPPPPPSINASASQDFGFLGNYLRDVGIYLLQPSAESVNQFGNLFTLVSNKPPIGYFTAITTSFSNLGSGSATITLITAPIQTLLDPLREGLKWVLWLGFAVFLIKRFANWDWHL